MFHPLGVAARTASKPVAAAAASSSGRGSPPILSRIVPGTRVGDWGTQEICSRHADGERSARAASSCVRDEPDGRRRIRPASGVISARRQAIIVDLPAPEGPDRAVTAPGRITPLVGLGAHAPRARTPTPSRTISVRDISGHAMVPGELTASASSMMSNAAREAVTPFADAWNCAPTWRSGSKTSGASIMTARPWNSEILPNTRRIPTSTATRATERVVRNSRTPPERKATRSVAIVAFVFASPSARRWVRGAFSRPSARSVGRPDMRSRSWAVKRFMEASLSSEAACVKRPIRIMKMGIRGMTTSAISADQKSRKRITPRAAGVTVQTRTS